MQKISHVIIPIFCALLGLGGPFLYNYLLPKHDLTYQVRDLLAIRSLNTFELKIENKGENSEKNIKVVIKKRYDGDNKENIADYDSSRDIKIEENKDNFTISIGDLKSQETFSASFILQGTYLSSYGQEVSYIEVKSDERIAEQVVDGPSMEDMIGYIFVSVLGIFAFLILLVLIIEGLKSSEAKIEMYEKEIEKIRKKNKP